MRPMQIDIDKELFDLAVSCYTAESIDKINAQVRAAKMPICWSGNSPKYFDVMTEGEVSLSSSIMTPDVITVKFHPKVPKPKKKEAASVATIVAALRSAFHKDTRQWLLIEELRMGSGYGTGSERTIDLWALNTYPSQKHKSVSYEIKRSRSDFLVDVKVGFRKHRAALAYSDEFYYVAPVGIIKEEDLPPWAGLIEVTDGKARKKHRPIAGDRLRPSWGLICSILRRRDRIMGG